jgi:hypothetical protein
MSGGEPEVIIIKKKAKGHAAHGAAWKVAYADFVTAMMALFMVLWLVSQTDQKIKKAISDYFRTGVFSGAPSVLEGGMGVADHGFVDTLSSPPVVDAFNNDSSSKFLRDAVRRAIVRSGSTALGDRITIKDGPEGTLIQIAEGRDDLLFELSSSELKPPLPASGATTGPSPSSARSERAPSCKRMASPMRRSPACTRMRRRSRSTKIRCRRPIDVSRSSRVTPRKLRSAKVKARGTPGAQGPMGARNPSEARSRVKARTPRAAPSTAKDRSTAKRRHMASPRTASPRMAKDRSTASRLRRTASPRNTAKHRAKRRPRINVAPRAPPAARLLAGVTSAARFIFAGENGVTRKMIVDARWAFAGITPLRRRG